MSADPKRPKVPHREALNSTDEELDAVTTGTARRHGRGTDLAPLLDAELDEGDSETSPGDSR
jgi:hypothetical protein